MLPPKLLNPFLFWFPFLNGTFGVGSSGWKRAMMSCYWIDVGWFFFLSRSNDITTFGCSTSDTKFSVHFYALSTCKFSQKHNCEGFIHVSEASRTSCLHSVVLPSPLPMHLILELPVDGCLVVLQFWFVVAIVLGSGIGSPCFLFCFFFLPTIKRRRVSSSLRQISWCNFWKTWGMSYAKHGCFPLLPVCGLHFFFRFFPPVIWSGKDKKKKM